MKTIFVVEDDNAIAELIAYALRGEGFEVSTFGDGEQFLSAIKEQVPDMVLLDIMLPGFDGITILKRIRENAQTSAIPVVMLTAKSSEYDKVVGLDNGADDYISKPFGVMELLARVRAVLRRAGGKEIEQSLIIGELSLDPISHTAKLDNEILQLTLKEFELLRCLMEHKGQVLTRDNLLQSVWGYDFEGETRTVDVHVGTLRQKLGDYANTIETVRGVGYRILINL